MDLLFLSEIGHYILTSFHHCCLFVVTNQIILRLYIPRLFIATNSFYNYSICIHLSLIMGKCFRTTPQVEIVEEPVVDLPRHDTYHTSTVATGKEGSAPGELYYPDGVAIHEETHQIFVANRLNDRVEIFSETGEFLYQLGVGQLYSPRGITTHGYSVYVSSDSIHTVSKLSLTEMCCVRRIGGRGSDNGQFILPRQLTTDPIGRVFIADDGNNRICIHDPDLNHLRNITHERLLVSHYSCLLPRRQSPTHDRKRGTSTRNVILP